MFLTRVGSPNLYSISLSHVQSEITFADVKRQLSQEEHEKIVKGDSIINFEGLSPAEFIVAALNLENLQYVEFPMF